MDSAANARLPWPHAARGGCRRRRGRRCRPGRRARSRKPRLPESVRPDGIPCPAPCRAWAGGRRGRARRGAPEDLGRNTLRVRRAVGTRRMARPLVDRQGGATAERDQGVCRRDSLARSCDIAHSTRLRRGRRKAGGHWCPFGSRRGAAVGGGMAGPAGATGGSQRTARARARLLALCWRGRRYVQRSESLLAAAS